MNRAPRRLQRKRTRGWRAPKGAVCVTRPTKWGNPHHVQSVTVLSPGITQAQAEASARAYAVQRFEQDLLEGKLRITVDDVRRELRGKDLLCWCPLPKAGEPDNCHASVLLRVANEQPATRTA